MNNINHHNNVMFCWESCSPGTRVNSTWHTLAPIQTQLWTKYTPLWWQHSTMTSPPPPQQDNAQHKDSSGMTRGTWQSGQGIDQASESPISQSNHTCVGWAGLSPIHGGPNAWHNGTQRLHYWCWTAQDTSRGQLTMTWQKELLGCATRTCTI